MAVHNKYKYNPENFRHMLNIADDLSEFYRLLEIYRENENDDNWFYLRECWETLFFSIKHREVEGYLNPVKAQEMRNYLEELIND